MTALLDTKIKTQEADPEKRWITTWNYTLRRHKLFYRWLLNARGKSADDRPMSEWKTPAFLMTREKKTVRLSPYSEK